MQDKYIFQLFKTKKKKYVYDRSTNSVTAVSSNEFEDLRQIDAGNKKPDESNTILKYQQYGLFKPNDIQEIKHPFSSIIEHKLNNCVEHLTLQVTQQCNLRCEYCGFSGLYNDSRQHANKKMDFAVAKRAIDFFLNHSNERNQIHLSFYGGEPLLEFELIKKSVEYIKQNVSGKQITYGLTTNGTLLKGEIAEYLLKNHFNISVSLDGPKEEHDANRRFVNGRGSFDTIMENVRQIQADYPELKDKIRFITVLNPKIDLLCVMEYFNSEKIFGDSNIMFNMMNEKGIKQEVHYREQFRITWDFESLKFLLYLIGKIDGKYVSGIVMQSQGQYSRLYRHLNVHTVLPAVTHPGGPCAAGVQRLFVDVNGRFLPCERVDETADCFVIGSLDKGYDLQKILGLLNNGKITEDECKNCWNLVNCKICTGNIELNEDKTWCKENKLKNCVNEKKRVAGDLYELCVLHEMGYDLPQFWG